MNLSSIHPSKYTIEPSVKMLRNKLRSIATSRGLGYEALTWYCYDLTKIRYYGHDANLLNMHIDAINKFTDAQIKIIKDAHKNL